MDSLLVEWLTKSWDRPVWAVEGNGIAFGVVEKLQSEYLGLTEFDGGLRQFGTPSVTDPHFIVLVQQ